MAATSPVEGLSRALSATGDIVAGVRDDQWSNQTPCEEWDARTLLNHLIGGNILFEAALRTGQPATREDLNRMRSTDHLGNDPLGAYRASADTLVDAFSRPGVLESVLQVPAGQMPGIAALHLRITETLVHGWDLARATGQEASLPEDLAEQELEFSRTRGPNVPRTGSPFGPERSVHEDAPAIDRLAAFLGRSP